MTDEEALKEIDRQEKRLAAAKRKAEELVAAAEKAEAEGRMKIAEAKKLRSRAVQYRRIVKDGECLKNQEHMARIRFEEKVRCLVALKAE